MRPNDSLITRYTPGIITGSFFLLVSNFSAIPCPGVTFSNHFA